MLYTICLVVSFGTGFFVKIIDNTPLDNFQDYQQIFNAVTGLIFGLILAVVVFYLGKKHDYKKDFIKNYAEL